LATGWPTAAADALKYAEPVTEAELQGLKKDCRRAIGFPAILEQTRHDHLKNCKADRAASGQRNSE